MFCDFKACGFKNKLEMSVENACNSCITRKLCFFQQSVKVKNTTNAINYQIMKLLLYVFIMNLTHFYHYDLLFAS